VEGNVTGEYSKESGRKKGDSRKKGKKPSNEVDMLALVHQNLLANWTKEKQ
jgi:hypothetical protein